MARIFTADECGLLKAVDFQQGPAAQVWGTQTRARATTILEWSPAHEGSGTPQVLAYQPYVSPWELAAPLGRHLRTLAGLDPESGTALKTWENVDASLRILKDAGQGNVLTINDDGDMRIVPLAASDDLQAGASLHLDIGASVRGAALVDNASKVVAVGDEHLPAIWDLAAGTCAWSGKNVPHDKLDMRVAFRASGVIELGAASEPSTAPGHTFAVALRNHSVYIYDTRAKTRPVQTMSHGEYPYTCISAAPGAGAQADQLVVADTTGEVYRWDLRKFMVKGRFGGPGGSIRSLQAHPQAPLLAAVGLDRCLWVWHWRSRRVLQRVYLKQRLNAALWDPAFMAGMSMPEAVEAISATPERAAEAAEEEELWEGLRPAAGAGHDASDGDSSELDEELMPGAVDMDEEGSGSSGGEDSELDSDELDRDSDGSDSVDSAAGYVDSAKARQRLTTVVSAARQEEARAGRAASTAAAAQAAQGGRQSRKGQRRRR